jgi:6-phosphogluconate dehydrogenase
MTKPHIGLIGLGTMGAMLALNIAEKGFAIAVWNRTTTVTRRFHAEAGALAAQIVPTETLADLVAAMGIHHAGETAQRIVAGGVDAAFAVFAGGTVNLHEVVADRLGLFARE